MQGFLPIVKSIRRKAQVPHACMHAWLHLWKGEVFNCFLPTLFTRHGLRIYHIIRHHLEQKCHFLIGSLNIHLTFWIRLPAPSRIFSFHQRNLLLPSTESVLPTDGKQLLTPKVLKLLGLLHVLVCQEVLNLIKERWGKFWGKTSPHVSTSSCRCSPPSRPPEPQTLGFQ